MQIRQNFSNPNAAKCESISLQNAENSSLGQVACAHLSVPSVCDCAVGVRVLVRGCSLCRVRDPVRVAWCGCGARASCSVEAEPGVCTGYSAHDSAIFKATAEQTDYRESVRQSCVSTFQGLMGVHTGASPIYGSQSFP